MTYDYETTCPYCGKNHTIPYQDVRHHIYKILGKESARKRKDLPEHLAYMQQKRRRSLPPKQQAILDLSKEIDLNTLKLREIADKVGITGANKVTYVWHQLNQLKKKGLLTVKRRMEPFPIDQI